MVKIDMHTTVFYVFFFTNKILNFLKYANIFTTVPFSLLYFFCVLHFRSLDQKIL